MKNVNKRGISLIVLVVTIIVMIILATAIILSLSSSGIIGKSNQAKRDTDNANLREAANIALAEYELEVNVGDLDEASTTAEDYVKSKLRGQFSEEQIESVKVHDDGTMDIYPVIPDGFVVSEIESEQKIAEGLVVYEIPEASRNSVSWTETVTVDGDEILKVQNQYNQYVWVPVPEISEFKRKDWGQGIKGTALENDVKDYDLEIVAEAQEYATLKSSVEKYKGFYIARYEAGKISSTTTSTTVNYGQRTGIPLSIPLSRKGIYPVNAIPWDLNWTSSQTINIYGSWDNPGVAKIARNAYDTNVKSHLIYGVEWDATLNFISKKDPIYATDSAYKGWYSNNYSENRNRLTGKDIGANASNMLNNIYDMAGNVTEWTMEIVKKDTSLNNTRVVRGGLCDSPATGSYARPASHRAEMGSPNSTSMAAGGFRVALYIK